MKWTTATVPNWAAAAILAVLTLSVFYVLQDYGPESAIRRFMAAVATNDDSAAQMVVDSKLSDPSVQNLAAFVKTYLNRGVQPQIARMDRQDDRDQVVVVYHLANGDTLAIVWIVDKVGRLWRINTRLTWDALRKSLPGYSLLDRANQQEMNQPNRSFRTAILASSQHLCELSSPLMLQVKRDRSA